jgi:hypothetical protein
MADWRDCFVSASDDWTIRTEKFGKMAMPSGFAAPR